MDLLFALPKNIIALKIMTFLTIVDFGKLDSALTNHMLRKEMYRVYLKLQLKHTKRNLCPYQIMWFFDRSIPFDELILTSDLSSRDITEIFKILMIRIIPAGYIKHLDFSPSFKIARGTHFSRMLNCCIGIESINLSQCKDVTNNFLGRLGKTCKKLRAIDVSLTSVTDSAIITLGKHCTTLTSVNLNCCRNVTEKSVIMLAGSNPQLSSLCSKGNEKITIATVLQLAEKCSSLTYLDLSSCPKISKQILSELSRKNGALAGVVVHT